jgi:CheY-like chemotaxis protein
MTGPAAGATILVVDDDALIAMNTVDMVQNLGHTVLEAYSGKQALDILASGARVDVLVTDYSMPGMTGELRPGLPVLLATGYSELPDGVAVDLPRLGKPYQQRELGEHLSQILGQQRQGDA